LLSSGTPTRWDAMPYVIEFAASVRAQMRALKARERVTVLRAIERRLAHEPLVETRNRKPLRPNPVAPWELRVGRLRMFHEVAPTLRVRVLAVGK
jgi:hypothetical protein